MSNESFLPEVKKGSLVEVLKADAMKKRFAELLPKVCTPERFARIALLAVNKNPKLLACTQESVISCMLDLASFGIEPDGRRAHLIPYGTTCTLIMDWKGLVELAKRNGDVKNWRAQEVCERDTFAWHNGQVEHVIDFMVDRGSVKLYYSEVTMNDGSKEYEVMTLADVETIRTRSKAAKSGPWVSDFNEMGKKTVIRRHSKRLTLSPEFSEALNKDFDRLDEIDITDKVTVAGTEKPVKHKAKVEDPKPEPVTEKVPTEYPQHEEHVATGETESAEPVPIDRDIVIGEIYTLYAAAKASTIQKAMHAVGVNWQEGEAWQALSDEKLVTLRSLLK